jgi:hypothetical protein
MGRVWKKPVTESCKQVPAVESTLGSEEAGIGTKEKKMKKKEKENLLVM